MPDANDIIALDSEAYYGDDLSITTHGVVRYTRETDHYMISLAGPDWEWVGHPTEAPWERLHGQDICMHNSSYDTQVLEALFERGIVLRFDYRAHCTADLSAYLQHPRSLKDASSAFFGVSLSKDVREKMKNRRFEELAPGAQEDVRQYALRDAAFCRRIWVENHDKQPQWERDLSRHTTMMGARGIGLDVAHVERGIDVLSTKLVELRKRIPWAEETDRKGKPIPITSPKALAEACRRACIPVPESTAADDERFDQWAAQWADKAPFVEAIQEHRSVNRTLKVYEAMRARAIGDRLHYSLKYYGAVPTGRWAGDNGLNMQNLMRDEMVVRFESGAEETLNNRWALVPKPGHVFVNLDFTAIEVYMAFLLSGNWRRLNQLATGIDVYEIAAREYLNYTDPRPLKEGDPKLRNRVAKPMTLSLQFGTGKDKFSQTTGLGLRESEQLVHLWRRSNPEITRMWDTLGHGFKHSITARDEVCDIVLPSGRVLRYWQPQWKESNFAAYYEKGRVLYKTYPANLFQHTVQATARDLLGNVIVKLESAGLPVVLHVHDEVNLEVPADRAHEAMATARDIMTTPPDWAAGLPLAVGGEILTRYQK